MEEKKKAIVVAIKNKDGNDILGYHLGDSEYAGEPCMVLYRPIFIQQSVHLVDKIPVTTYATTMYFRYGNHAVNIPYASIECHDLASEFFTLFYSRSIGDLIAREEELHNRYMKFYVNNDIKEAMENTDSIFVDFKSQFIN